MCGWGIRITESYVPDAESALGKVTFLDDSDLWFISNSSTILSQYLELFDQNWFRLQDSDPFEVYHSWITEAINFLSSQIL